MEELLSLQLLELLAESKRRAASFVGKFVTASADKTVIKVGKPDELSISSAELAEKLDFLIAEFRKFINAVSVSGFDECKSSSDFNVLVIRLYSLAVLQLSEFLLEAEILRLKFSCENLDADDFVNQLFRIACIDRRPDLLKNGECTVNLADDSHVSSCCGLGDCCGDLNPTTASREGS